MKTIQIKHVLLCVFFMLGCSPEPYYLSSVLVLEKGYEQGGEFCKDFNIEASEVEKFFNRAEIKTSREIHNEFEYLPCYVRGTALIAQKSVQWEIRAGGSASLVYPNGLQTEFGCKTCF